MWIYKIVVLLYGILEIWDIRSDYERFKIIMYRLSTSSDGRELLRELSNGNEAAFRRLFDQYSPAIYRTAMVYLKEAGLAEEVVQDVFMKLWTQRERMVEVESIESWLFVVAKNTSLNEMKKLALEKSVRTEWVERHEQSENTTDHSVRSLQYEDLIRKAVGELPEQQQKVFKMAKEEGLSYQGVADELSLSPLTVKTHVSRALKSIRSFLVRHGESFLIIWVMLK